jgi:hypothetical protein
MLTQGSPDHHLDDRRLARIFGQRRCDELAVTQDDEPICDLERFWQAMGREHDRHTIPCDLSSLIKRSRLLAVSSASDDVGSSMNVRERLHLRALSQSEGILDIDAEVAGRALDFRMAEQDLNGAAGFLLNYGSSRANPAAADQVADLDLDDVAPAQLAVDREIERRVTA